MNGLYRDGHLRARTRDKKIVQPGDERERLLGCQPAKASWVTCRQKRRGQGRQLGFARGIKRRVGNGLLHVRDEATGQLFLRHLARPSLNRPAVGKARGLLQGQQGDRRQQEGTVGACKWPHKPRGVFKTSHIRLRLHRPHKGEHRAVASEPEASGTQRRRPRRMPFRRTEEPDIMTHPC